jgi:zinc transport system substrate-binding protein
VTQHAAFGYLAKQYGLTQEAISGLSPEEEPTASRLAELKHYVEDKQIQYIYFEENTTSKVASTLAKETGVKTAVLNPIEGISTKEIKKGATYLTVMEDNLKSLQKTVK